MNIVKRNLMLHATILAVVFSAAGYARGGESSNPSGRELQAKLEYCKDCHGLSGQGYRGFLVMPRLAGQSIEYIENQLLAFAERRRDRDVFINMAKVHGLSSAMRTAVAAHLKELNPRVVGGAPRHLVATGRQLFEEGVPEANIPACAACHGPDAKGQDPIPRLAGQLYPYIVKELSEWSKERGKDAAGINDAAATMAQIARSLTRAQIAAIAAYLCYQE
jgi:cytochrome c553